MKTVAVWSLLILGVLVAGCSKKSPEVNRKGGGEPASVVEVETPALFVSQEPTGIATPIPEARKSFSPGSEVLLKGLVMGTASPFVEGRASFVLGDEATLTPCNIKHSDRCPQPWDTCCDPIAVRAAGTAAVQVLGNDGKVLQYGLKGVGGLKELSRVTVRGVVAPGATKEAFVVNATALFVEAEKQEDGS